MIAQTKQNIHETITNSIIEAMEAGVDSWQMPWHKTGAGRPINVSSGKPYNGINVLALWLASNCAGYVSNRWGTYKQWQAKGAQVRKGAKATTIVFYKKITYSQAEDDSVAGPRDDDDSFISDKDLQTRLFLRVSKVFNADQVVGYTPPAASIVITPLNGEEFTPMPAIDAFVSNTSAEVRHEGDRACYWLEKDFIQMPPHKLFIGSPTLSATEAYYSTLLHELVHWTGHKQRCARDMTGNRASEKYAFEELIAELGSAYLCADLQITPAIRPDHAAYIKHWLGMLKADEKAIFRAAAKASQASEFLHGLQNRADAAA